MAFDGYQVLLTVDAESDLNGFLEYLLYEKRSDQAALNVLEDFTRLVKRLEYSAGSYRLDEDPKCAALGYHRIHFDRHDYFALFRIEDNVVTIDRLFHNLQDYRNHV